MASRLAWLSSCTASQLRSIAIATGINRSGTKSVLIPQLNDSLTAEKFSQRSDGVHILSIDMGIRNLAYCQMRVPNVHASGRKRLPLVLDWNRIAVATKLPQDSSASATKEAFDPAVFSQHSYNLIERLVLSASPAPHHVLIERQRFRSGGGPAVLEWTLRVNMFEAMLYATLKTLNEQGKWAGTVFPVMPSKVGQFWIGDDEEVESKKKVGKARKRDIKLEKIQVVDEMLKARTAFALEEEAENTAKKWRDKMEGKRGKSIKDGEKMGKLDDLADCLLQALAWAKWEENRRDILEHGVAALDGLNVAA